MIYAAPFRLDAFSKDISKFRQRPQTLITHQNLDYFVTADGLIKESCNALIYS